MKRRLLFAQKQIGESERKEPEIVIESEQHVCGSQLFPDNHFFVQRIGLNCESPMEARYYTPNQPRSLKFPDVCCKCGDEGGLLLQKDIEEKNLSDGNEGFPICSLCVEAGLKPVAKLSRKRKSTQNKEMQAKKKAKHDSLRKSPSS